MFKTKQSISFLAVFVLFILLLAPNVKAAFCYVYSATYVHANGDVDKAKEVADNLIKERFKSEYGFAEEVLYQLGHKAIFCFDLKSARKQIPANHPFFIRITKVWSKYLSTRHSLAVKQIDNGNLLLARETDGTYSRMILIVNDKGIVQNGAYEGYTIDRYGYIERRNK